MSVDEYGVDSSAELLAIPVPPSRRVRAFPFERLTRMSRDQIRVEHRLRRLDPTGLFSLAGGLPASAIAVGAAEVLWRPSGVNRSAVVVQCVWPRHSTRLGIGLETQLAHGVVDQLLGTSRLPDESRLPISPVEWGIVTFLFAEALRKLRTSTGPLGSWDLLIDRVGPDPLDLEGLGRVVTIRWPLRIGDEEASLRLWIPETLIGRWLAEAPRPTGNEIHSGVQKPVADLSGSWRAEAGKISVQRGLQALRAGGLLPLSDDYRRGTVDSPEGLVQLIWRSSDLSSQAFYLAEAVHGSGGRKLSLMSALRHRSTPRDSANQGASTASVQVTKGSLKMDAPVTLVVELGRVNLTIAKLADLKPGDVVDLQRHSREPVELTSGGRTVARGELVQIDDELGVRVTHVLL